jgi:hypothetical protein
MPVGLRVVSSLTDYSSEYVAWAWAVNGFASVVGAVLTTLLAMALGFSAVLVVGLGVYVVGVATMWSLVAAQQR